MNDLPDRPATPPLPPPDGAFGRVQRRAFLRRLRVPAAGAVGAAVVVGALSAAPVPQAADRLQVAGEPTATVTTAAPDESYSPEPGPSATRPPSATLPPSTAPVVTATPTPTGAAEGEDEHDGVGPTTSTSPKPPQPQECNPVDDKDAAITGVVVDRGGKPLQGITVTSFACNAKVNAWLSGHRYWTTDAQGRFRIPCYDDHWAVAAPFEWYTGERSTGLDVGFTWFGGKPYEPIRCGGVHRIVLRDAATVNVQLVDPANQPVGVATQVPIFMREDQTTNFAAIQTGTDGRGTFTGLAPGSYTVWTHAGHPTRFTVAEGQTVDVKVWTDKKGAPPTSSPPTGTPTATP